MSRMIWKCAFLVLLCGGWNDGVEFVRGDSLPPGSISEETPAAAKIPLLVGITDHKRQIATGSTDAQRYFDQGLNLAYAFNHDEAIRSFRQAAQFDPGCAMAQWGIALCSGPHINNPVMDEARSKAAW